METFFVKGTKNVTLVFFGTRLSPLGGAVEGRNKTKCLLSVKARLFLST